MARKPRLFAADFLYHVVQRGNNKNPIFFQDRDYLFFLNVLKEAKSKHPCFIFAYCLMTNHFHLIIQPKEKENVSLLLKLLGGKYARYINKVYDRTGTLWEGRFKCSLIDKERYFWACLRYVDTNPIRAGLVKSPEAYPWSSCIFRLMGKNNSILDLDPLYEDLGRNLLERQLNYRRFIESATGQSEYQLIREMTRKNGIIGNDDFKEKIEKVLNREIILRPVGRPFKQK